MAFCAFCAASEKKDGYAMRGCEKKVLYLKKCESKLFDEAYFVLRKDAEAPPSAEDMLEEATRIIRKEISAPRAAQKKKTVVLRYVAPFSLGILCSALLFGIFILF